MQVVGMQVVGMQVVEVKEVDGVLHQALILNGEIREEIAEEIKVEMIPYPSKSLWKGMII
jgi:hypothetical protein